MAFNSKVLKQAVGKFTYLKKCNITQVHKMNNKLGTTPILSTKKGPISFINKVSQLENSPIAKDKIVHRKVNTNGSYRLIKRYTTLKTNAHYNHMKYHFSLIKLPKIKQFHNIICWHRCRKRYFHTLLVIIIHSSTIFIEDIWGNIY